jgi:hypothetical protein
MVAYVNDRRLGWASAVAGGLSDRGLKADSPGAVSRRSHNCELLLRSQDAYQGRCAQAEISGHEAIVSAMAVGVVIDVWRNGPVEGMHCGKRGADDAAMFAESTSLHEQAVTALTAGNRPIGLLELADHLLDRERPWAGTGGKTLKDLGTESYS